jgi:D-beta-D-heptose 7-phosphate kinase/D-beta-D-heptose 1-phosphate adenosyltransferase
MTSRVLSQSALLREVRRLRRGGKRIVTTNGSFDLLHVGHVRFLERASRLGDALIVLLNSDASIRKLKGPSRPVLPQRIRAEMMVALRSVGYVTVFDDDNPLGLLRRIKPDVHAKGGSWKPERIAAEKKLVESWGGNLRLFPMIGDHSTTKLIEKIQSNL